MPNIASAKKRTRTTAKRKDVKGFVRTDMREALLDLRRGS